MTIEEQITDIIAKMRDLYNGMILGKYPDVDVRFLYDMSDSEYAPRLKGYVLCQGIANMLISILKNSGYRCNYLFFYQEPLIPIKEGMNKHYLNMIADKDLSGFDSLVDEYISRPQRYDFERRTTHGMVQIFLGREAYVVDPYCCLFYKCGKEALIHNPQLVYDLGYYFLDQGSWLHTNSIHKNRSHRISASPLFWESVYHISSTANGDLPQI